MKHCLSTTFGLKRIVGDWQILAAKEAILLLNGGFHCVGKETTLDGLRILLFRKGSTQQMLFTVTDTSLFPDGMTTRPLLSAPKHDWG